MGWEGIAVDLLVAVHSVAALFLADNMEMTEIVGEHACYWALSACKMFGSSGAPVTLAKALWSLFHLLKGLSVRMEQATASSNAVEIRLQERRSITVTRAVNGSRGPWKKFPHWSFARWQVLGMLAVDRTRSGPRLESCALDYWKSWHPQRRSGAAEKGYDESWMFVTWFNVVGWVLFCGCGVLHAVGP